MLVDDLLSPLPHLVQTAGTTDVDTLAFVVVVQITIDRKAHDRAMGLEYDFIGVRFGLDRRAVVVSVFRRVRAVLVVIPMLRLQRGVGTLISAVAIVSVIIVVLIVIIGPVMMMHRRCAAIGRHHAGLPADLQFAVYLELAVDDDQLALAQTFRNDVYVTRARTEGNMARFENRAILVRYADVDQGTAAGDQRRGDRYDQGMIERRGLLVAVWSRMLLVGMGIGMGHS